MILYIFLTINSISNFIAFIKVINFRINSPIRTINFIKLKFYKLKLATVTFI